MREANQTAILHRLAAQFGVDDGQARANPEITYLARRGAEVADRESLSEAVASRVQLLEGTYPDAYSKDEVRRLLGVIAESAFSPNAGLKSFLRDSFPPEQAFLYRDDSAGTISEEIVGEALAVASSDLCFIAEMKRRGGTKPHLIERLLKDLPTESIGVAIRLKRNQIEKAPLNHRSNRQPIPVVKLAEHPEFQKIIQNSRLPRIDLNPGTRKVGIVLAGGRSTRVRTTIPKGLIFLGDQSMIERTITNLRQAGVDELIVGVGHRPDILRLGLEDQVEFCELKVARGVGFRALHALHAIRDFDGTTILTYSDMPFISAASFGELIRTGDQNDSFGLLVSKAPHLSGKIVPDEGGRSWRILQKRFCSDGGDATLGDVGAYSFKNSAAFRERLGSILNDNIRGEYYFANIVQSIAKSAGQISPVEISEHECMTVNNPPELLQSQLAAFLGVDSYPPDFRDREIRKQVDDFFRNQFGFTLSRNLGDPVDPTRAERIFGNLMNCAKDSIGTIFGCPGKLREFRACCPP